MRRIGGVALWVALAGAAAGAEEPESFELTVDGIMRGPKLVGRAPTDLRWSGDSKWLFFEWQRPNEDEASTWVVAREGGEPRRLSEPEKRTAPPADGVWDEAARRVLFVEDGDVVLVDSVARERRQVTRTASEESNPRWARGDSHVSFTREDGLYMVPVAPGAGDLVVQLLLAGPKEKEPELTPGQEYLKQQERKLIEHVREQAEKKEKDEAEQKQKALPRLELASGQRLLDAALAPDGRHAFVLVSEKAEAARTAEVPDYVTESAYAEMRETRSNVGDAQEKTSLAIVDLETKQTRWAEDGFAQPAEPAPKADVGSGEAEAAAAKEPKRRRVEWSLPLFSRDGRYAVASVTAADNKDRWLVAIDAAGGAVRVLNRWHDEAWVRWVWEYEELGWLPDGRTVFFLAERGNWMHLYSVDVSRPVADVVPLTSGDFELTSAWLGHDGRELYFVSTEADAAERRLYSIPASGGPRTLLTSFPGTHAAAVSPDGRTLGLVLSRANQPPELFLAANRPGAEAVGVTTTPTEAWRSFAWIEPELVHFTARDGVSVPARLYTPARLGAARHPARPGVVFIHGAGYLQNAHRYWSSYYREYMFHHLLAARGYVVLDVDYRGSAGYGRDWRTAIYRHMGGKDLEDVVDGAKWLVAEHGVDPERLGVYGGSYGGFLTFMAMFTAPDVFAAGAALRPVTDWTHYNHGYTSAILNTPQHDAEAFARSSPIHFAEGLRGALLICHGMVDENVHFQDSVRLVQRLIELRKQDWELAVYPVEDHAFEEETSWADEYRRILALFERHLTRPAGAGGAAGS